LFLRICFFRFVCSGLFVQVCLFICLFRFVCSDLFRFVSSDLFVERYLFSSDSFLELRFFRFVPSHLFLQICLFSFVSSEYDLFQIRFFRFVSSLLHIRFFLLVFFRFVSSDSFLQMSSSGAMCLFRFVSSDAFPKCCVLIVVVQIRVFLVFLKCCSFACSDIQTFRYSDIFSHLRLL
jgi:hypothetical protein